MKRMRRLRAYLGSVCQQVKPNVNKGEDFLTIPENKKRFDHDFNFHNVIAVDSIKKVGRVRFPTDAKAQNRTRPMKLMKTLVFTRPDPPKDQFFQSIFSGSD
ncbi:hypothetical protein E2542_SST23903 [Spatholobus suberectus]|nr:hypothetical protein E2542_SST23903 [Spatholobus suberectus]